MTEIESAEDFWRNKYAAPFLAMDPDGYADQFGFPCMIRAENMPRTAFSSRAELLPYVTEMIERAKHTTWVRTELDDLQFRLLEPGVAKCQVAASRYDAAGALVSRVYADYTMCRDDGAWKMTGIFGGFLTD